MIKKYKIALVLALVIVAFTGSMVKNHLAYHRELDDFRVRQFDYWIMDQRGAASGLDYAISQALVAKDAAQLSTALSTASERAYRARETSWDMNAAPNKLRSELDRWRFDGVYSKAGEYLHYLSQKEPRTALNVIELRNLELIRLQMASIFGGFDRLSKLILYESSRQHSTYDFYPWSKIVDLDDTVMAINETGVKVNGLSQVGADDPDFATFKIAHLNKASRISLGLEQSNEPVLSDTSMLERGKEFLRSIIEGEVTSSNQIPENLQSNVKMWTSGWGSGSNMGPHTIFALKDTHTGWNINVGVTAIGGHINEIEVRERITALGGEEEAIRFAQELVSKWAQDEGISLELHQSSRTPSNAHYAYAPVVDGVLITDKIVNLSVNFSPDYASSVHVSAQGYFHAYGSSVVPTPELTVDEATSLLPPTLKLNGEPRLESTHGLLLWAIPVTGVDRVSKIYLDALTGEFYRMDYEFFNP